jgi:hypothetical protein
MVFRMSTRTEDENDVLKMEECPLCGLTARSMLHRFCQHDKCPVRAALAATPAGKLRNANDRMSAATRRLLEAQRELDKAEIEHREACEAVEALEGRS